MNLVIIYIWNIPHPKARVFRGGDVKGHWIMGVTTAALLLRGGAWLVVGP